MKTFLTIARVLYDKGYNELIEASRILKREGAACKFQWLGQIDTQYPQPVTEERIMEDQRNGLIEYLGEVEDVRDTIRASDCVILPSYHEGMSRVLMEATAMSKPIITSDIAGCREVVEDGGNGFLCKPRDVESLVAAIKKFMTLDESQVDAMGAKSREIAEAKFDVRDVIKAYETVIDELLQ